jgi:hypothetical protein
MKWFKKYIPFSNQGVEFHSLYIVGNSIADDNWILFIVDTNLHTIGVVDLAITNGVDNNTQLLYCNIIFAETCRWNVMNAGIYIFYYKFG